MFVRTKIHFLMGNKKYLLLLGLNLFYLRGLSATVVGCLIPKEANDILKCLQEKHPEVISNNTIKDVTEKLSNQGSAWKNPQISFETLGGYNLGSSVLDSELRISQTIEFSGQRGARQDKGKALGDVFQADSLSKIEEITLMGVRSLYRLTQLKDEVGKIEESIQKFRIINNQYQSRPRLNPEQEITSGLIQLAVSEVEFRLNQASSEKNEILSELQTTTKLSIKDIEENLPDIKNALRPLPQIAKNFRSSSILKTQAEVNFSKSSLDEARAEAWPEFTVDFIAQNKIDGSLQYQMYGAGVSFPLPIFQRNEGEKSLKAVEFSKASNIHAANLKKQESLLQNLTSIYEASVKNLKNTPSNISIENKHKKAEQLFAQGLISGPLIIETHKQILEYTQIRNLEELKALEAQWRLFILEGDFLNQKL